MTAGSAQLQTVAMSRSQVAQLLLALCLLQPLVPLDLRGALALAALLALPCAPLARARSARLPVEALGGATSGLALCALALHGPEIWPQTTLVAALVWGGALALGLLPRRAVGLALGLGVLAPLGFGALLAAVSPGSRGLLVGAFGDWGVDYGALQRFARWLALSLALLGSVAPLGRERRWLAALPLVVIAAVLVPRVVWLGSTLSLPTDLLIWSEPPLLLNLWKMREGAVFYGPFARFTSYSYSPALEHLQYGLLRPVGLELSLLAHRALGVLWQLLAALCLVAGLARYWGRARTRTTLLLTCLGCLFSSLLAPHLHPDHLLMLALCGAFWLVMRQDKTEPWSWLRLTLLVFLPVLATMVKLTGAGIGLGLGLVYLWERDFRRVGLLAVSGVLALSTIWLFDATLGSFSDYAIRLQASHPLDVERASMVWATPPLLLCLVAVGLVVSQYRASGATPAARAAVRVLLLTSGIGVTSLAAYAKHGGRENSLLPFALGGLLAVVLVLAASPDDSAGRASSVRLYQLLAVALALVTPIASPLLGEARANVVEMHQTAVSWLSGRERQQPRLFVASTAAYLGAGWRRVPDAALATLAELDLAGRPEVAVFEQRVRSRYYDGLFLPASTLRLIPLFQRLLPCLEQDYAVVGPPALAGAWPTGLSGYVIAERRAARDIR